jgi:hypothetical protein
MSDEIDVKLKEKLSLILYPECLDFSKVISILNEDFSFSGNDLYFLKEISKLFSSKELLFKYLLHLSKQKNPIISVNEDFSKCQLIINDNMVYYQFVNIPTEYNSERVKLLLGINEEDYSRLYKSSIFWVLISEKEEFNKKFENVLKEILVDKEGKKLKYNITSAFMIKKMAKKQIDKRIYNQETESLKNNEKNNIKNNDFNRSKKSDDSMSWRKKSDLSNDQDNLGYGYSKNYGNKRRQRFKSDPYEYQGNEFYNSKKNYINNDYQKDIEDLKVQLDDVKYPIFIKEKYTNKEILDYLAQIKSEIKFDEKNFSRIIDDIIDKEKMKNLELENKKEYEVPKNNPLLNFKKEK